MYIVARVINFQTEYLTASELWSANVSNAAEMSQKDANIIAEEFRVLRREGVIKRGKFLALALQ